MSTMQRLTVALLLFGITLAPVACKRDRHAPSGPDLLSVVPMDDSNAGAQLVRGFYPLEGGPWRWTAGRFSVILRPPPGAAQFGARLELKLNIPEVACRQLGAMTLSATADGQPLAPEKYAAAGDYVYARDVPAAA